MLVRQCQMPEDLDFFQFCLICILVIYIMYVYKVMFKGCCITFHIKCVSDSLLTCLILYIIIDFHLITA